MDAGSILTAASAMAGLGIILSLILALANKKLYVFEDPRIDEVDELLPQANCGACGYPGCRAFSEALVEGKTAPAKCTVGSPESIDQIATLLGVDAGGADKRIAYLACAGGSNVARQRASYDGVKTCQAANLVAGGGKGCTWGCLGLADCERVCDFDAIHMDENSLPVVDAEKCTACGDCVEICPKALFSIQPMSYKLWVACKNLMANEAAEDECEVACTGCGRCAIDAPEGVINMIDNLAVINYNMNEKTNINIIQRCPTGAIVWRDKKGDVKGQNAKKIIRKSAIPLG
ncbi:MAG: RnfABCDGE type electron transport complex subunit B [Spirochaetia bacterium]|nr:RnfABCDGE type electron transport complex subunit B [Spirochaetia bacterium]